MVAWLICSQPSQNEIEPFASSSIITNPSLHPTLGHMSWQQFVSFTILHADDTYKYANMTVFDTALLPNLRSAHTNIWQSISGTKQVCKKDMLKVPA